jgi:hypothetical protein
VTQGLEEQIRRAFANVQRPPNGKLHASDEGDEGELLELDFADKHDWRKLDADFLAQAPRGDGSALSFFTPEAFRYFLPAYLLADLEGRLEDFDVAWHLSAGLSDAAKTRKVNPQRYGDLTWFDTQAERFAMFSPAEVAAIAAWLEHKASSGEGDVAAIRQALVNYWRPRLGDR